MNRLSSSCLALCVVLASCVSTEAPESPTVARTLAPQDYQKTITSYFAFKIRGPQKNTEISFGEPEPSGCPLDGYITSSRGWVVPVAYATRVGELTGQEVINITLKQYYFWFRGNIIAGISPRIDLCPGVGSNFSEGAQPNVMTAVSLPARPVAQPRRDEVDLLDSWRDGRVRDQTKAAGAKKKVTSSGKARPGVKKAGETGRRFESERQR